VKVSGSLKVNGRLYVKGDLEVHGSVIIGSGAVFCVDGKRTVHGNVKYLTGFQKAEV
jgi:cytoskeletal protein CcmA (bactofilin family)